MCPWSLIQSRMLSLSLTVEDFESFEGQVDNAGNKNFEDLDMLKVLERPIVFCTFGEQDSEDPVYLPVKELSALKEVLGEKLNDYNEVDPGDGQHVMCSMCWPACGVQHVMCSM